MKIEDLTKSELLSLIYHNLPETVIIDHPVFCASCSKGWLEPREFGGYYGVFKAIPFGFICDDCEKACSS